MIIYVQAEIAVASPRIRFTQRKNMLLRAENDSIRQKIATVSGKLMLKEGSPSIKTRKTKALGACFYHFLFFKTMNLSKLLGLVCLTKN